jgi:hypothetical protein
MDFWYGMDARYSRFLRECNEIVEAIWRWDSALYDVRVIFLIAMIVLYTDWRSYAIIYIVYLGQCHTGRLSKDSNSENNIYTTIFFPI